MKVYAVLPWSCGCLRATFHELDSTLGREGMLAQAWSRCVGSQYVRRIYAVVGGVEVNMWTEHTGWTEEAA